MVWTGKELERRISFAVHSCDKDDKSSRKFGQGIWILHFSGRNWFFWRKEPWNTFGSIVFESSFVCCDQIVFLFSIKSSLKEEGFTFWAVGSMMRFSTPTSILDTTKTHNSHDHIPALQPTPISPSLPPTVHRAPLLLHTRNRVTAQLFCGHCGYPHLNCLGLGAHPHPLLLSYPQPSLTPTSSFTPTAVLVESFFPVLVNDVCQS